MIVKALLAAFGLRALPDLHNQAVHDARNVRASALAGHARLVHLQQAADRSAALGDHEAVARIAAQQSEVRDAMRSMLQSTVDRTR